MITSKREAMQRAMKDSKKKYPDEVVVVFKLLGDNYSWCLESTYTGDEDLIYERYLNGQLAPE
jgi:hypothetical protein